MPISIDEFRFPRFIKSREKKPFIEDTKAKFMDGTIYNGLRRFQKEEFPQAGYNSASNLTNIRKENLDKDELTLPPTIV